MKAKDFLEGIHYYYNEDGLLVFTEKYHLERGFCCGKKCKHCPYHHENVPNNKSKFPSIDDANT